MLLESCVGQPTEGNGIQAASSDPCWYAHSNSEGEVCVVAVYVDGIILGERSEVKMNAVKEELC